MCLIVYFHHLQFYLANNKSIQLYHWLHFTTSLESICFVSFRVGWVVASLKWNVLEKVRVFSLSQQNSISKYLNNLNCLFSCSCVLVFYKCRPKMNCNIVVILQRNNDSISCLTTLPWVNLQASKRRVSCINDFANFPMYRNTHHTDSGGPKTRAIYNVKFTWFTK